MHLFLRLYKPVSQPFLTGQVLQPWSSWWSLLEMDSLSMSFIYCKPQNWMPMCSTEYWVEGNNYWSAGCAPVNITPNVANHCCQATLMTFFKPAVSRVHWVLFCSTVSQPLSSQPEYGRTFVHLPLLNFTRLWWAFPLRSLGPSGWQSCFPLYQLHFQGVVIHKFDNVAPCHLIHFTDKHEVAGYVSV